MNCIIVPFFIDSFYFKSGSLYTGILVGLYAAIFAFASVESLDRRRNFFIRYLPIWAFLCQGIGVSVSTPLIWIPAYLLKDVKVSKTHGNTSDFFGLKMVYLGVGLFVLSSLSIAMFPGNTDLMVKSIMIFNVAPFLIPLLWILPRLIIPQTRIVPGKWYMEGKIEIYSFFSGIVTMFYWMSVKEFMVAGMPFDEIWGIMKGTNPMSSAGAALFLLLDCASLLVSLFLLDCVLNGFNVVKILRFIVFSVVLSPGTAFLLSARAREEEIKMEKRTPPVSFKKMKNKK